MRRHSLTGFALVHLLVQEYSVTYLVPRARFMHRRRDVGKVAWPGILARAKLLIVVAAGKEKQH